MLIELFRNGLSKISLVSYGCFVLSSVLLSGDILSCAAAVAGLTVLPGVLLRFDRRELRAGNSPTNHEVE